MPFRGKTTSGDGSFEGQYREGNREGSGSLRFTAPPNPVTFFGMFDVTGAVGRGTRWSFTAEIQYNSVLISCFLQVF